jgi:uncharacterized repeat protein (TIGR03803 family)
MTGGFKPAARALVICTACATLGGAHMLPAATTGIFLVHALDGVNEGAKPTAGLIIDKHGVLYGATFGGGAFNSGTVFSLTPPAAAHMKWTATTLWAFTGGVDGASPVGALIQDNAGALYGTTSGDGAHGGGTVFKLTPPAAGQTAWTETTLFAFDPATDGGNPSAGLIAGPGGVLYGTTASYGAEGFGTVFQLTPPAAGQTAWTGQTLWQFTGGADGANPLGSLLLDSAGDLYGTASRGGDNPIGGVVFELSPASGGATWTETTLANFTGPDGLHPAAALVADRAGNLYGTTAFGGANGRGTVFQLAPPAGGQGWTLTTLCSLSATAGGSYPFSPLLFDAAGVLYGTTDGYTSPTYGSFIATLFSLAPPAAAGAGWTITTLGALDPKKTGQYVVGGLAADKNGHLFGTAVIGPNSAADQAAGGVFEAQHTGFTPFK